MYLFYIIIVFAICFLFCMLRKIFFRYKRILKIMNTIYNSYLRIILQTKTAYGIKNFVCAICSLVLGYSYVAQISCLLFDSYSIRVVSIVFLYVLFLIIYGTVIYISDLKEKYMYMCYILLYFKIIVICKGFYNIRKIIIWLYVVLWIMFIKIVVDFIRHYYRFVSKIYLGNIVLAFILNVILILFMGVLTINNFYECAYNGQYNMIDLFYYTVIAFSTIGFGDIIPIINASKIMASIISISSIICISVLINYGINVIAQKNKKY